MHITGTVKHSALLGSARFPWVCCGLGARAHTGAHLPLSHFPVPAITVQHLVMPASKAKSSLWGSFSHLMIEVLLFPNFPRELHRARSIFAQTSWIGAAPD